jgi:MFS family permease
MAILGGVMLAVPLPISALLARSTPEEVGESPDGAAAPDTDDPATPSTLSTMDLLRRPVFWLCGIMFALQFAAGSVSVIYTVPYAQQLGLGLVASASILSLRSLFGALGKVLLGSLSDRVGVKRMIYYCFGVEVVLTALMVQTRDPIWFTVFGVGLGFVGAAMLPLKGAFVGQLFGRANFGSAFGLMQTVALPFTPLIIPLAGYVKDLTDDYAVVFAGAIPLYVVGALLLSFIKPPDARMEDQPDDES